MKYHIDSDGLEMATAGSRRSLQVWLIRLRHKNFGSGTLFVVLSTRSCVNVKELEFEGSACFIVVVLLLLFYSVRLEYLVEGFYLRK